GIRIEHIGFLHVGIVIVVDGQEAQRPLNWSERRLSFEQLGCDRKIVRDEKLFTASEKLRAVRFRSTYATWCRKLPRLELKKIADYQIEEDVLADYRRVTLQSTPQIRVPKFQFALVRRFGRRIGITLPASKPDKPPIRHRFCAFRHGNFSSSIVLVLKRVTIRRRLIHAFARQAQRSRHRLFAEFRYTGRYSRK